MTFHYMTAAEYRQLFAGDDKQSRRARLTVNLPYPPSANELRRTRSTDERNRALQLGKKVPGMANTERYRKWRVRAQTMLIGQKLFKVPGPFAIHLMHPVRKRKKVCDLDNRTKAVLDFLQSQKLIDNDNLCEGIVTHWSSDIEETVVHVLPHVSTLEAA